MLTHIYIRDYATIEEIHLDLQTGCTMITGETGAGKSVFIEAIELALGARASAHVIRSGKDKAEIALSFDLTYFPNIIDDLNNAGLNAEQGECIIRRTISDDGRTRCYVNDSPVTLNMAKHFGEALFHLHGQHEQQVLLKPEVQRDMLDRFANHLALAEQIKNLALQWKTLEHQLQNMKEKSLTQATRSDYLHHQLAELESLNLERDEWQTLEIEHRRLSHAETLQHTIQTIITQLSDEQEKNTLTALKSIRKSLEGIQNVEPKTEAWLNTLHSVLIQLQDLELELKTYFDNSELDNEKLQRLEERISQIHHLSRKYKIAAHDLADYKERLKAELNTIENVDEHIKKIASQQNEIREQYAKLAVQLSDQRKKAASKLEQIITKTIRSLSLPHGEFKISFDAIAEDLPLHGLERIQFLIKTNPDQTLQPLTKVISGGELSRLSLAMHLSLARKNAIPTLVFDEVDTGLSGAPAEKIGKLLRQLGESYQVFCVTHQPQVAACGHHHLLVEKFIQAKKSHTRLSLLSVKEKTQELARMLAGEKITPTTIRHAKELLLGEESS